MLTFVNPSGEVLRTIRPRKNGGEGPDGGYYHRAVIESIPEIDVTTHINRWLGGHLDLDLVLGGVLRDDDARGARRAVSVADKLSATESRVESS